MPCEVEGAWLSAWRLAKAARLSAVLEFCLSQLNLPSNWQAVLQCLIIEGCVSAWPEYSCCLLLATPLLADLTGGRPSYLCNSSCLSNIFDFSPSLKILVI